MCLVLSIDGASYDSFGPDRHQKAVFDPFFFEGSTLIDSDVGLEGSWTQDDPFVIYSCLGRENQNGLVLA